MQSVERVSQILLFLADSESEPLGVSEIARVLNLPKSLVHRTLTALVDTGLVQKNEASKYTLGARSLEFGAAALRKRDITDLCLPHMQRLSGLTDETITLSLLIGYDRTHRAQVQSNQDVRKTVNIGARLPLYAGASGRAMLAYFTDGEIADYFDTVKLVRHTDATITDRTALEANLADVRETGYAVSHAERDPWSAGIAAPIFDSHGAVIASLSVCAPVQRLPQEICGPYGELVVVAAAQVTKEVGGRLP